MILTFLPKPQLWGKSPQKFSSQPSAAWGSAITHSQDGGFRDLPHVQTTYPSTEQGPHGTGSQWALSQGCDWPELDNATVRSVHSCCEMEAPEPWGSVELLSRHRAW